MAKLDLKVKRFIVTQLACFDTPSQVSAAVKEEFGLDIGRAHVQRYDPTKIQGSELSQELRSLFTETRAKFKTDVEAIPLANQTARLRALSRLHANAESRGNAVLAASLLEQIAKEVGGAYTNTRRHEGGDPSKPIHHAHHKAEDLTDDDLAAIASSGSA